MFAFDDTLRNAHCKEILNLLRNVFSVEYFDSLKFEPIENHSIQFLLMKFSNEPNAYPKTVMKSQTLFDIFSNTKPLEQNNSISFLKKK